MTATHDALRTSLTPAELMQIRRHMLPQCFHNYLEAAEDISGDGESTDEAWDRFRMYEKQCQDWLDGK